MRSALTLIAGLLLSGAAVAQTFPSKPVTLIVPNPPGGVVDTSARLVSEPLAKLLGQPVVIENKGGASGNIAYGQVALAPKDGHTLLISYSAYHVGNPSLFAKLPWAQKDFVPVALLTAATNVIAAHPSVPANTLQEFISYTKANPNKLNFASQGNGSLSHVGTALLETTTGIEMTHVPYKGSGPALIDLSGGHVNLLLDSLISTAPIAQQGRAHLLAISTAKRSPAAPDLPTFAELGFPTLEAFTWNNLYAPAKTPDDIISKLNQALNKALTEQAVKDRLAQGASENLGPSTPAQADAFGVAQRAKWVPFIRALKIDVN